MTTEKPKLDFSTIDLSGVSEEDKAIINAARTLWEDAISPNNLDPERVVAAVLFLYRVAGSNPVGLINMVAKYVAEMWGVQIRLSVEISKPDAEEGGDDE